MSYVQIWLHCIWSTKNRDCCIPHAFRHELLRHFRENAKDKKIIIDFINCQEDHVHALINMGKQQNVATIMQYLKGESAFWINNQKILTPQFAWQDDYFAVSVSHSHVEKVRNYIRNQDQHHKSMSRDEELEMFINKYGFVLIKD